MYNQHMIDNIRWSVFVIVRRRRKRKKFGRDFQLALRFYGECREKGYTACLHSDNAAFPPPARLTEVAVESWEIVRRKGKRYKKRITKIINRMNDLNAEGKFWCPYCIQLRRFETDPETQGLISCQMCGITSRDHHVRAHNPKAVIVEFHRNIPRPRARRSKGRRRRLK